MGIATEPSCPRTGSGLYPYDSWSMEFQYKMSRIEGNKLYNNIRCLPLWTIPALKISSCRTFLILIFCWLNVFSFVEKHIWFEIEVTDCTTSTNIVNLMVFLKMNISLYFCLLERGISKWDSIKLGDRGQSTEKHAEKCLLRIFW